MLPCLIVASGASDHIYSSMIFFDDYNKIMTVNVKLSNGQMVRAKHGCTIKFSQELIAHSVLFVPDFNLNFQYVPKICIDIDYIITFDNYKCLI